jgi:tRNA pseudouridine55 synthase
LNGFLCVDKPQGFSSFGIIKLTRKALGIRKIGHSGTLDPNASGLLLIAIGKATRLLPFVPSEPKTYLFTIQFGAVTDTLDSEGDIIEQGKPIPAENSLSEAITSFTGEIKQTPPSFSAIKIKGTPAYKLARENKSVDIPERTVTISSLKLLDYDMKKGEASLEVECSKGTYVRSLARDIAEKAGTVGYASSIRRTAINGTHVKDAATLEDIQQNIKKFIIPVERMLEHFPSYIATSLQIEKISHGNEIKVDKPENSAILFIYDSIKEIIAVAEKVSQNTYHPIKVFLQP